MDKALLDLESGLMKKIIAVSALLAIFPNIANAEYDDEDELALSYGEESFVSIATGRRQPISKAPAVASVVTSADIRKIGARDLDEALETVAGLHVSRKAGIYNPVYSIRGIFSEFNPQVLVLINGFPINSIFSGDRSQVWGGMPVENISRIEVIRGPGSAVYGADAFSGTINIVTKTANEIDGFQTGASYGTFDERRVWAQYGGKLAGWDVALSAQYADTNGQDEKIAADTQSGLDQLFLTSTSLAPGEVNLGKESLDLRIDISKDKWRFRAGLQDRKNVETGAGASQALDPVGSAKSRRVNVDLTYHDPEFSEGWDTKLTLSYFDLADQIDLQLFPSGAFGGAFPNGVLGEPDIYERHYRFDVSAFYTNFDDHDIRIGIGYHYIDQYRIEEHKNFEIVGPIPTPLAGGFQPVEGVDIFNREEEREVSYISLQDEWKLARDWALTLGVRYDHYSDFGDTINPRAALVWNTSYKLTTKMLYGRAFRAPSFGEQFNQANPVALGNDSLDPEIIDTYELAFDYAYSADIKTSLNIFYYKMQDIIAIRFNPARPGNEAQNTGDQTGHGLEFEFEWGVTRDLTLKGNYAYQDSEDRQTDSDAANSPQQQFYLSSIYRIAEHWQLGAQVNHVMDRKRAAGDIRDDVDDYTTLDLTLRRANILPGLDITLSARNVTDEDVFEPSLFDSLNPNPALRVAIPGDLPQAGRSIFLEIRKSWH